MMPNDAEDNEDISQTKQESRMNTDRSDPECPGTVESRESQLSL